MRKKKRNLIFIIVLIACAIGLGYAYLNSDLALNGYAGVSGNTWDVHLANLSYTTSSGVTCSQNPQIDPNDNTRIIYNCSLNVPNDYVKITVDMVNGGTIDAMLNSIASLKVNNVEWDELPSYYNFIIKNYNGLNLEGYQLLPKNTTQQYIILIEYNPEADLLQTNQSISFELGLDYSQADENAFSLPNYAFAVNNYKDDGIIFQIGDPIPLKSNTWATYQELMDDTRHNFFFKHNLNGNIIQSTELAVVIDDTPYYLCGGIPGEIDPQTQEQQPSVCYEHNKQIMQSWVTNHGWSCGFDDNKITSGCSDTGNLNTATMIVMMNKNEGTIVALNNENYTCAIDKDGRSGCGLNR